MTGNPYFIFILISFIRELLNELKSFNRGTRNKKPLFDSTSRSSPRRPRRNKSGRLLPPLLQTLRFLISDERKVPTKSVLKIKRPVNRKQKS